MTPMERRTINRNLHSILDEVHIYNCILYLHLTMMSHPNRTLEKSTILRELILGIIISTCSKLNKLQESYSSFEDSHTRVCTKVFMSKSVEKNECGIYVRDGGAVLVVFDSLGNLEFFPWRFDHSTLN